MDKILTLPPFVTRPLTIATYDVTRERDLRLSSQLKLQQEIGEVHLQAGGLPYLKLYDEEGMLWVLTRARSVRHRAPQIEERVQLKTWSRGIRGAQFFRCYQFQNGRGEALVSSISSFALVDSRTHTLLRPASLKDKIDFCCQPDTVIDCPVPEKIKWPGGEVQIFERSIRYSDIDSNNHLNNAVYADFMGDFFPGNLWEEEVEEFEINFLKEAVLGDMLEVQVTREGNRYAFRGIHPEGECFQAWCRTRPRSLAFPPA